MISPVPCADHPARQALVRCATCQRALCDDCYRFRLDARAACARCAYEVSTRGARRRSLAVTFLGISLGGLAWLWRRYPLWQEFPGTTLVALLGAPAVAWFLAASGREQTPPAIERRDPGEDAELPLEDPRGGVFRARARRLLQAASPKLSASSTALVLFASLAVTAVAIPAALHLPRWVEVEVVLALWWLLVGGGLTALLYRGFRLRDDFVYFAPWDRPAAPDTPAAPADASPGDRWKQGCSGLDGCSGVDGEGCAVVLVVGVALALAAGVAWVVVELAAPLLFFALYALFMRAIGRVANDRHGCEGRLSRAARWGFIWATVYLLPVGLIIALADRHARTLPRARPDTAPLHGPAVPPP